MSSVPIIQILEESYRETVDNKQLVLFALLPSIITSISSLFFFSSLLLNIWQQIDLPQLLVMEAVKGIGILATPSYAFMVTLGTIFLVIVYFLVQPIVDGGLTKMVNKIIQKHPWRIRQGIHAGFMYFFPMFELRALMFPFQVATMSFMASQIIRNFGWKFFLELSPFLLLIFMASIATLFILSFTEYAIVHDNMHINDGLKRSSSLVMRNPGHTLVIWVALLLVFVRTLLVLALIFLLPLVLIVAGTYFYTHLETSISMYIFGALLLVALGIVAYTSALINVFTTFVWAKTYRVLTQEEA